MKSETEIKSIIIAEQSPVISSGINYCLHHLSGLRLHTMETETYDDLLKTVSERKVDVILVNPTFGGSFDPVRFRDCSGVRCKIAAIETGLIDRNVINRYDGSISITDDMYRLHQKLELLCRTPKAEEEQKESLSQREREIISYVVKGYTNKEIADKLFLSVHTVITHRRNIARKLEIHSATGLTIYAIVNKLVDLSEIKL